MRKLTGIIEKITWIPFILRNKYLCKRDRIVNVDNHSPSNRVKFRFEIIDDEDCHSLSRNLQAYKIREPRNVSEYIKFIDKDDIVLDVGANIGFFTVLSKSAKKIIAIEPIKKCIPILENNMRINNIENVEILNVALGHGEPLYMLEEKSINLSRVVSHDGDNVSKVESIKLSDFSDKYGITFVKIDAEGYEYNIFGEGKVPDSIKKIAMEFHTNVMGKEKSLDVINNLYNQGFEVKTLIEDLPLRLYPFMKILTKVMTYVKKNLNREETIKNVFTGRGLKYLYFERKEILSKVSGEEQ